MVVSKKKAKFRHNKFIHNNKIHENRCMIAK
jgi:hypothetical protein